MSGNLPSGKDLYVNPFKGKASEVLSQAAIGPGLTSWRKEHGGGTGPEFANPKDFFNGKWESQLTGEPGADSKTAFAKYGPAAMIFGPAIWNESTQKGDKIREDQAMQARNAENMARFNSVTPYNRYSAPQGENPFSQGYYNDLAGRLAGPYSQMGGLL